MQPAQKNRAAPKDAYIVLKKLLYRKMLLKADQTKIRCIHFEIDL